MFDTRSRMMPLSVTRGQAVADANAEAQEAVSTGPGYYDMIMLQGFGWDSCREGGWWNKIAQMAPEIASAGFTHIWLPPVSQSVSEEGYLPSQFYNFNSKYGSEQELRDCVKSLKDAGVKAVADMVLNHRCADTQDDNGNWVIFSDACEPEGVATCSWREWAITNDDPEFDGHGGQDTGEDFHAAPDLDHTRQEVQDGCADFCKYLCENVGFEGLRFDFSKGYAGRFAGDYSRHALGDAGFAVGEFWTPLRYDGEGNLEYDQEDNRQQVRAWIDETGGRCCAFDFSTKGILQDAIRFQKYDWLADRDNKPHGLVGVRPDRAVLFTDNHDTGSSQSHWPFPRMKKLEGYAYILSHPGMPSVFWEHMYADADELKEGICTLMAMRKRNGIVADSSIEILQAAPSQYIADVRGQKGTVRVKLGPEREMGDLMPAEEDGWERVIKGSDFCLWEKRH